MEKLKKGDAGGPDPLDSPEGELLGLEALDPAADDAEVPAGEGKDPGQDSPGDVGVLAQEELYEGISSESLPSEKLGKKIVPLLLAGLLCASGAMASAGSGEALMLKGDCFSCHSVKSKGVGPAYLDVAKKYRGNKNALAMLVKKVKSGGSGNWGSVPMVAHPQLSDADARAMVAYVLSLKK